VTESMLCAAYSQNRGSWCVFKKLNDTEMKFLWCCHNKNSAEKLSNEIKNGAEICRGSKEFGSNCGSCVKCELTK